MASQKTKFAVGLFVTVGIGIAIVAVIWLGMSSTFQKGRFYAAYFDESVQGLDKDSPLKYRGVSIGRVERIGVASDSRLIEVILKVETGQPLEGDIVAQLKIVGITGSMFIELDRKKEGEPDRSPSLTFPSEYPIVASKPSDISELLRGFDDIFNQIKALDLKGISDRIKLTLENVNQKVEDADLKSVSENLNALLLETGRMISRAGEAISRVERLVADNERGILAAVKDFSEAMKNADAFFAEGASLIGETDDSISHLKRHLLVVGQNLERASASLSRLIDLVSDHPSQLLLGEPPAPRKVEP
ncbi:MAG: MCE family protein [Deltaproteobacteria bacterium]|nr:MCE family protein [Deltaproteobacteria bacterium]